MAAPDRVPCDPELGRQRAFRGEALTAGKVPRLDAGTKRLGDCRCSAAGHRHSSCLIQFYTNYQSRAGCVQIARPEMLRERLPAALSGGGAIPCE